MKSILRVLGATTAAAVLCVVSPSAASASTEGGQSSLAAARAGTAAYHDLSAVPADYVPFLPCLSSSEGGMGKHFVDFGAVMDATEDAAHPEALVYAETSTGYRLVAVEYIVPAALVPDPQNPPSLFGQPFTEELVPGAGDLYVLHAWIWNTNPEGMFKDWNPDLVSCSQTG